MSWEWVLLYTSMFEIHIIEKTICFVLCGCTHHVNVYSTNKRCSVYKSGSHDLNISSTKDRLTHVVCVFVRSNSRVCWKDYSPDKCRQEIHPLDKLLRTSRFIVKTTQTIFPSDRQFQTRFLFVRQIVSVRQTSRFCSSDEKSIRWTSCCGHRVLWWKRHRQDFHLTDNSR